MSNDPQVLAEQLLGGLHDRVGRAEVIYAEPPVRLGGGFFAENYAFRLAGASPPWDGPLVVRLFPSSAPPDLAHREAAVQAVLAGQGYPAARVVLFEEKARLLGRRFFVMERLPGRPMVGGIRIGELARSGWRLFTRLADVTATLQVWLHRLDAGPLLAALGDTPAGIERWFVTLETLVKDGADGLSDGLQWLIDHRPAQPVRASIWHDDLWGGNVLTQDGRVTGVLDWTVATVAEPALDVGFTAMSLCLAPIDAPRPIQRAAARLGRSMCRRYIRAAARDRCRPLGPAVLRSTTVRGRAGGRRRLPTGGGKGQTPRRPPLHVGLDHRPDGRLLPREDRRDARAATSRDTLSHHQLVTPSG